MHLTEKIGFIGGGKMGEALIKGIIAAGVSTPDHILVVEPDEARRSHLAGSYGVIGQADSVLIWKSCTIVILAVKPQIMKKVLAASRDMVNDRHLIISIAAGIPLAALEKGLAGRGRLIRVMPNTPALVLEAATAISAGSRSTAADLQTATTIFEAVGKSVILEETYLDAVTGLSGSGPAYVFSFIEAMIDAGVKVGLGRDMAEKLALQTVLGSVKLAMSSQEHPAQLRAMVTSPGGTTIAGQHVLERAGFAGIIMDAVEAAVRRSRELGG